MDFKEKNKNIFLRVQSDFGDTAKNERILRDIAVNQELEHTYFIGIFKMYLQLLGNASLKQSML